MAEKDFSNPDYQKMMWDFLKKSLNGIINKLNSSNIQNIVLELFNKENKHSVFLAVFKMIPCP